MKPMSGTKIIEMLSKSEFFEGHQKSANSQGHSNFFEVQRVQIMKSAVFCNAKVTCAFCIVKHRSKRRLGRTTSGQPGARPRQRQRRRWVFNKITKTSKMIEFAIPFTIFEESRDPCFSQKMKNCLVKVMFLNFQVEGHFPA